MWRWVAHSASPRALRRSTARSGCATRLSAKRPSPALHTGAAICGLRPVLEIMFIDFATLALDCLVNQAPSIATCRADNCAVPMVVRTQAGAAGGAAAQHSQSLEAWFIHVPGLVVVAPSSPVEAYGLLKSSIRLGDPVLFIEHKRLYAQREALSRRGRLPEIGKARVARSGTDVTVIAYSAMVRNALEAADELGALRHFGGGH